MRRRDKQITDRAEIDALIRSTQVVHVAMAAGDEPYLVPLNFGYDGTAFYFHTATRGRKLEFFATNPRVCFACHIPVRLVEDAEVACRWTMEFASVIGYGTIAELLGDEKRAGLNQVMRHYSGRDWEFAGHDLAATRIWRLNVETVTGKRSPAPGEDA